MNRLFYSVFGPYMDQFIELKKSLGYKYSDVGHAFSTFDGLAVAQNLSEISVTKEFADEWCTKRPNESDKTRYNRIQQIRQFSQFLCDLGFRSYLPKLPQTKSTFTPYIFSQDEIQTIFTICDAMRYTPRHYNSSLIAMPVLFRLLYATGIRISEALYLTCNDINLKERYLVLRQCKNGKDRLVPFSESVSDACNEYVNHRKLIVPVGKETRFFVCPDGSPLTNYIAYKWFRRIIYKANISHGGRGVGPRMHDLRHTFSVHSLATMSESGLDLYYSLPILSTYLGHQSLGATDRYVRLTSEMYPDLIKKSSDISSSVFPVINQNPGEDETN
jgi:integrase/recombinase XerD